MGGGNAKHARDTRINLRVSIPVDERVDKLAEIIGLPKSAVAATALVMGLRILEMNIIGQAVDAEALALAQRRLYEQMGQDVEGMATDLEKVPTVERPAVGFRPKGELGESEQWVPVRGYMAGL